MAEELREFTNTVEDEEGASHIARVYGGEREDGEWVGWIEFIPTGGGATLVTGRETTQPNRKDLEYWAGGLTYYYLEGALHRAKLRGESGSDQASGQPRVEQPVPERGVPRLEVVSAEPDLVQTLMGVVDAAPGTIRKVPDAGVLVYEGTREGGAGEEGPVHVFAVQYGSDNAGATLANWLWSRLHGHGATVRVDGRTVPIKNDALRQALVRSRT